jgi:DNA polymerase-3 subunit epsilon
MFALDRDLVFFDLETTGLDILKDRIVQIALIKYPTHGGKPEEVNLLVNPGIPIPPHITAIHGLTDEMVAMAQTFEELAPWLYLFIGDADLAGYNSNRFDVPMLLEAFARSGMRFSLKNRRLVDVQTIFHKMEPRNLRAAYRFYCNENLVDAHNALADVRATAAVFKGQLARYVGCSVEDENGQPVPSPIHHDMQRLHEFINDPTKVDSMNRFRREPDGTIVFNFGKNQGKPIRGNETYLKWMLEAEFSAEVKDLIRDWLNEK